MSRPAGLLVTPGASATRDHRTLLALEDGLDLPVERIDFGRTRSEKKIHAQLADDVARFADRIGASPSDIVLGGRSFGGRMCSTYVAAGNPAAGLALLSYPLHPPGKPEKLRTEHFGDLDVPCLFVSGTRDPFGAPDEFAEQTPSIVGPCTFAWIDGGVHDPKRDDEVVAAVAGWLAGL